SYCVQRVIHPFCSYFCSLVIPLTLISTLFPYTTLFRSLNTFKDLPVLQEIDWLLEEKLQKDPSLFQMIRTEIINDFLMLYPFVRSEEHTSELQSRFDLVCRLLLEKKK